jgi:hypothetical protein
MGRRGWGMGSKLFFSMYFMMNGQRILLLCSVGCCGIWMSARN